MSAIGPATAEGRAKADGWRRIWIIERLGLVTDEARQRGEGEPIGQVLRGWLLWVPAGQEQPQYFTVGKIAKDQADDYATRKGIPLTEA